MAVRRHIRRPADVSDVRVMSRLTSKKGGPGRTAESDSAEMVLYVNTFANNALLDILHVVLRPKSRVLVITYDEDDVRFSKSILEDS